MLELLFGQVGHVTPAITISVVIVGMFVLAVLDVWKEEVEDYASAALLGVAIIGVTLEGISPAQWLGAAIAAGIAFLVYLNLGMRGVMGGGDVKLSIVPAFVLGASNPLLGIWWIAGAILIHQSIFFIIARASRLPKTFGVTAQAVPVALPHVPAMAIAMLVSTAIFPPFG